MDRENTMIRQNTGDHQNTSTREGRAARNEAVASGVGNSEHINLVDLLTQLEVEKMAQGDAFKAYTELATEQVQANTSVAAGFYSLLTTLGALLIWLGAGTPAISVPLMALVATWVLFNLTRVFSGARRGHRSRESYRERISWLL